MTNLRILAYLSLLPVLLGCEKNVSSTTNDTTQQGSTLIDSIVTEFSVSRPVCAGCIKRNKTKTVFIYDKAEYVATQLDTIYYLKTTAPDTFYTSSKTFAVVGDKAYINGVYTGKLSYGNRVLPREIDTPYFNSQNRYPNITGGSDTLTYRCTAFLLDQNGRMVSSEWSTKNIILYSNSPYPDRVYLTQQSKTVCQNDNDGIISMNTLTDEFNESQIKTSPTSPWQQAPVFSTPGGINQSVYTLKKQIQYSRSPYKKINPKFPFYTGDVPDSYYLLGHNETEYVSVDKVNWTLTRTEKVSYDGFIVDGELVRAFNTKDKNNNLTCITRIYYKK